MSNRPPPILLDQQALNEGLIREAASLQPPDMPPQYPVRPPISERRQHVGTVRNADGYLAYPPEPPFVPTQAVTTQPAQSLSASQKKRARKRRKNRPDSENLTVRPTNGYNPIVSPPRCTEEIIVKVPTHPPIEFRVRCDVDVNPHKGQPHIFPLVGPANTTVFIGWWSEEEQG